MTKHRSISLMFMAALCLLLSMVTGCSSLNLFNNDFLNTFMPFGQTSLNNIEGKGPVTIVLENLTEEARHGEDAIITIRYIDENGQEQALTPSNSLKAVPEVNPDDPDGPSPRQKYLDDGETPNPDYDPDYKETFILDCGVREIWVTGTVYRRLIEVKTETNQVDNDTTVDFTYCTASPNNTQSFTATQLPSVHLEESKHFKCGDVIVIGLLDVRASNGSVVLQTYPCEYTNWASLSDETQTESGATPFTLSPSNLQLISDPVNQWMQTEYRYPTSYVLIPVALPNLASVEGSLQLMIDVAKEYAEQ